MYLKVFSIGVLVFGLITAQNLEWDPFPRQMEKIDPREHCNQSFCDQPCEFTAPPPFCPEKNPECSTGCVCMAICGTRAILCYETKHCREIKRIFTRRRKTTTLRLTTNSTRRYARQY